MKAKVLSVSECAWTPEERHLADEGNVVVAQRDNLCLPNLFKSKKVKAFAKTRTGPTYRVHRTARELLLELLDRGAVHELAKRAGAAKPRRSSHGHGREPTAELAEGQYAETLTWFSIVLQSGLSAGQDRGSSGPDVAMVHLDRWQGVLKRSSFQTSLLSLSRLEDADKMEVLSAFCSHLTKRCQVLYTPGQHLAVKKYSLTYQQAPCPLHLALLCDLGSGFICNMYLYSPEQLLLQRSSRTGVVEHVLCQLLRPYYSRGHLVQLDASAWTEGRLTQEFFFDLGVNVHFVQQATEEEEAEEEDEEEEEEEESVPAAPRQHQWVPGTVRTQEDRSSPALVAHLQGWSGPALFPQPGPKGPAPDVFLPGFWATLHMVCINAFVLHTLQCQAGSGGTLVRLREFTRSLAAQLAIGNCVAVPTVPGCPRTGSCQDNYVTNISGQRCSSAGCGQQAAPEGCFPAGVCGLANSGNSCYLNAVLQCLCSTVPLVEYLLDQDTRSELDRRQCPVAGVLVGLLEEMWLGRGCSLNPVAVRSMVRRLFQQFDNQAQHDAQELLLFLLNALHDDLQKKGVRYQTPSSTRVQDLESPGAEARATVVTCLFEGRLGYVTLCLHCHRQAHSLQVFTVLSLPIPDRSPCSIQDCLSLFFQQSTLTSADRMLCSGCGVRRDTAVLTTVDRPPEILMLHLKRFACHKKNKEKLKTNVLFSLDELDLTPFLSSPSTDHRYYLYAVVNHVGTLDRGHYTSLCYNAPSGRWHCFDDSRVSAVQDVQSPHVYILLYSRQPFRTPRITGL